MVKKVLIVNTSTDHFADSDVPTGLWLGELVHFYDLLHQNHVQIDIVNTKGGLTPIDPVSTSRFMLDKLTKKYLNDDTFMTLLKNSPSIKEVTPTDYNAVYFTGGHGVMYDFQEIQIFSALLQLSEKMAALFQLCVMVFVLFSTSKAVMDVTMSMANV